MWIDWRGSNDVFRAALQIIILSDTYFVRMLLSVLAPLYCVCTLFCCVCHLWVCVCLLLLSHFLGKFENVRWLVATQKKFDLSAAPFSPNLSNINLRPKTLETDKKKGINFFFQILRLIFIFSEEKIFPSLSRHGSTDILRKMRKMKQLELET